MWKKPDVLLIDPKSRNKPTSTFLLQCSSLPTGGAIALRCDLLTSRIFHSVSNFLSSAGILYHIAYDATVTCSEYAFMSVNVILVAKINNWLFASLHFLMQPSVFTQSVLSAWKSCQFLQQVGTTLCRFQREQWLMLTKGVFFLICWDVKPGLTLESDMDHWACRALSELTTEDLSPLSLQPLAFLSLPQQKQLYWPEQKKEKSWHKY